MAKQKRQTKSSAQTKSRNFPLRTLRHFGGSFLKGNPRSKRPISTKESIHIVLKSVWAMGSKSMLQKYNSEKIDSIIRENAEKFKIRVYHLVNVGNHLHLVVKLDDEKTYPGFIRAITGLIARHVLKKQRGPSLSESDDENKEQFWVTRPFSRIIAWGRDYKGINQYMEKNKNQVKTSFAAWGFEILDLGMIQNLNTS